MNDEKQTVAQKILFNELCDVFKEIKNTVKTQKYSVFKRFLQRWRKEVVTESSDGFQEYRTDDSFYPAMRLFLPSKDKGNRDFQIKEARLNHLVTKALFITKLDKKYEDHKEVLVEELVAKSSGLHFVTTPKLSIADINDSLDRIKAPNQIGTQEDAMYKLCRQCTENELRWLFHIILDDIERQLGGLSSHTIMEWFHLGADNLWKEGNSLLQICEKFAEEESADIGGDSGGGNLLCKRFRPMLLKRLNYNKYCLPKIIKFCQRPFYLEVKYDGEHLLVHKFQRTNYKYFTRNGVDYTHKMGATNETLFSKRIHPFFKAEVKDCVLDCEILIWDQRSQEFVGKNKRASDGNVYDPKLLDEDFFENHTMFNRSLAVFDILYLNGSCLLKAGLTMKDRMEVLGKILDKEDRSTIFVSQKQLVNTANDFTEFYKRAMRQGEEGIVVKGQHSFYRVGSRAERNGWFKIKPDYGAQSVLDLAIVGVRYENVALRHIKSFLVAARHSGHGPELHLKIVAGITSRLKAIEYQKLKGALGETEELLETRPEWVEGNGERDGKNDRFLARDKIQVVEVRASGLLNGKLQFPSIVSVRSDKLIDEVDSVHDVSHFDERLRSRPMVDEPDAFEANVMLGRKKRNQLELKKDLQLVKTSQTDEQGRYSDGLKGRKVCVLNANGGTNAQELQKILINLGATPIGKNNEMAFAVAMDPKTLSCASKIKANRVHIVHGKWLLRCQERKALLPWTEEEMIHKSENANFHLFTLPEEPPIAVAEEENEGEMQTEETNGEGSGENGQGNGGISPPVEQGREESRMDITELAEQAEREEQEIVTELMEKMSGADCQPVEEDNIFADFVFFLHESLKGAREREEICRKIERQNGKISDVLDEGVTHVVVDKMRSGQEKPLFDWNERQQWLGQFVGRNWVEKAIEEGDRYRLPDRIHEFIEY